MTLLSLALMLETQSPCCRVTLFTFACQTPRNVASLKSKSSRVHRHWAATLAPNHTAARTPFVLPPIFPHQESRQLTTVLDPDSLLSLLLAPISPSVIAITRSPSLESATRIARSSAAWPVKPCGRSTRRLDPRHAPLPSQQSLFLSDHTNLLSSSSRSKKSTETTGAQTAVRHHRNGRPPSSASSSASAAQACTVDWAYTSVSCAVLRWMRLRLWRLNGCAWVVINPGGSSLRMRMGIRWRGLGEWGS